MKRWLGIGCSIWLATASWALGASNNALGPLYSVGDVSLEERQLVVNRIQEQLNRQAPLVSMVVIDQIKGRGYHSADPEVCEDELCRSTVLRFLQEVREEYAIEKLYLPQLVRVGRFTQLMVKQIHLRQPLVIEQSATKTCEYCAPEDLLRIADEAIVALAGEPAVVQPEDSTLSELDSDATDLSSAVAEPEEDERDPYEVAQEAYNPQIVERLKNLTFALQVFPIGLSAFVQFEILPDGTPEAAELIQTSGSGDFDRAVLSGIGSLQFDPLPPEIAVYERYVVQAQVQNFSR